MVERMKKKIIICSISLLIIFFLSLVLINYYNERVILNINGESELVLSLNDKYNELGAMAKVCSFNRCKNITENVHIKDNIDTDVAISEEQIKGILQKLGNLEEPVNNLLIKNSCCQRALLLMWTR